MLFYVLSFYCNQADFNFYSYEMNAINTCQILEMIRVRVTLTLTLIDYTHRGGTQKSVTEWI